MEKVDSALCQWIALYIHYFNLHVFYQPNNITSLAYKLNLIFKVSQTKKQTDIPLWTHMEHNKWSEDEKTFARC